MDRPLRRHRADGDAVRGRPLELPEASADGFLDHGITDAFSRTHGLPSQLPDSDLLRRGDVVTLAYALRLMVETFGGAFLMLAAIWTVVTVAEQLRLAQTPPLGTSGGSGRGSAGPDLSR
jgi:hypothetical protein